MRFRSQVRRFPALGAMAGLGAAMLLLTACDNDKDIDPPAELVELQPRMRMDRVWSKGLKGAEHLRLPLRPASDGTRVYAASNSGDVYAFDLAKGSEQWHTRTRLKLSAGPGIGEGYLLAGSSEGDVVALRMENGSEVWRVKLNGEVLAAPAVSSKVSVVRTVDGRLHGLDTATGKELWLYEQNVPRLSLRGTSPPVIIGETVVAGFDNGKVAAVNLTEGTVVWESTVAPSHGRTEIERLVDIDSAVQVVGNDVFVAGFQGRAAMLALESGQIWWSREMSSERGLAVGADAVYITTSVGEVVALGRRDGAPMWEQKLFHRRGLTAPGLGRDTLAVGDFEGVVHWLDTATGVVMRQMKTDGQRITNAPLAVGDMFIVLTDGGQLAVFRQGERLERKPGDDAADARAIEEARQKAAEKAAKEAKREADRAAKKRENN